MRIVAISGSLRAASSNAAVLRAAAALAPPPMTIELHDGLGALPHFNPDLDQDGMTPPDAVAALRAAFAGAAGFVVSSPEYAHGVPGSLKNALDWLVSSGEFVDRPVLLVNAAPVGGAFAQASLAETLRTMSARVLSELATPWLRNKLAPGGALDPEAHDRLRAGLVALAVAVAERDGVS